MRKGYTMYIIFGVILITIGACCLGMPEDIWQLKEGYKYKDVEPSELSILSIKLMGVVSIVVGIGMIIYCIWSFITQNI